MVESGNKRQKDVNQGHTKKQYSDTAKSGAGVSKQGLRILGMTLICFALMLGVAAVNKSRSPEYLIQEYTIDDSLPRHVKFETMPADLPQQAVGFFFKYQGMAQYELCESIVAGKQSASMNFPQQAADFSEGRYIKEYIVHSFETLPGSGCDDLAKQLKFKEYRIVRVTFSQKWSEEALKGAPQWGDGEYTRNFAVGKERGLRGKWKIFEVGMM